MRRGHGCVSFLYSVGHDIRPGLLPDLVTILSHVIGLWRQAAKWNNANLLSAKILNCHTRKNLIYWTKNELNNFETLKCDKVFFSLWNWNLPGNDSHVTLSQSQQCIGWNKISYQLIVCELLADYWRCGIFHNMATRRIVVFPPITRLCCCLSLSGLPACWT